jgi:DNA polymerase-3 subunit delta'
MHAFIIEGNFEKYIDEKISKILSDEGARGIGFSLQKISQVEEISKFTRLSFKEKTAVIIRNVEKASLEAKSAILKTLEEPPDQVIFILTTSSIYLMPKTIISRCRIIKTKKMQKEEKDPSYISNFLKLPIGQKLAEASSITSRDSATDYLENLISQAHSSLHRERKGREALLVFLDKATSALDALKANGNVRLQLVNLLIQTEAKTSI